MIGFTAGLPIRRVGHDDAFGDPAFLREALQTADALGFWGVTAPDHIVAPNAWARASGGEAWLDPFVLLGYAAGITARLRLITHIIVLPYRSPFAVAKAIASLDAISGGRAVLGVGSGYLREEFEILGVPFEQRGARTDEGLRAIKACWTDGDIDFDGEFFAIHEARLAPQPVQPGGPPVWIGGNSLRALRRAIEIGDCWAPFDVTDEQLRAGIARAEALGRRVELAAPVGRIAREGSGLTGDAVAERVRVLRDIGVDYAKCGFGGRSTDAWLANMRWFAEQVMPAFQEEESL
jgi:probable F420-dependent oxidoreductase